jgi:hypothetical protein
MPMMAMGLPSRPNTGYNGHSCTAELRFRCQLHSLSQPSVKYEAMLSAALLAVGSAARLIALDRCTSGSAKFGGEFLELFKTQPPRWHKRRSYGLLLSMVGASYDSYTFQALKA